MYSKVPDWIVYLVAPGQQGSRWREVGGGVSQKTLQGTILLCLQ